MANRASRIGGLVFSSKKGIYGRLLSRKIPGLLFIRGKLEQIRYPLLSGHSDRSIPHQQKKLDLAGYGNENRLACGQPYEFSLRHPVGKDVQYQNRILDQAGNPLGKKSRGGLGFEVHDDPGQIG